MLKILLTQLARHMVSHQVAQRLNLATRFDWRLGLRLMRDQRVPLRSKAQAVGLGLMVLMLLEFFELPLQLAAMVLLPIVGFAADFALDGIEVVAVPFLIAAVALPFLAPREVVESLRPGFTKNNGADVPTTDEHGRVYSAVSARID